MACWRRDGSCARRFAPSRCGRGCTRHWSRRRCRSACRRHVMSRQMRWPRRNRLAVAMISMAYSTTSPGFTGLPALARQRMPRLPRLRALRIERAQRRLEPAARQLALGQIGRHAALAFARGLHRDVGADVLEHHDPVGVVLVDRGPQVEHDRAGDQRVLAQRLGHVAQALDLGRLRRRHLHEGVGRDEIVDAAGRERLRPSAAPMS